MAFECPSCGSARLGITFSLELPPSGDDDEITLQTLKFAACNFRGVAVYRESRHGRMDSESWQHDGYPIGDAQLERIYEALLRCPAPSDKRCQCSTHLAFAEKDSLAPVQLGVDPAHRFELRLKK